MAITVYFMNVGSMLKKKNFNDLPEDGDVSTPKYVLGQAINKIYH
jgi:hypothetical protein